jgi:hypothetical protein
MLGFVGVMIAVMALIAVFGLIAMVFDVAVGDGKRVVDARRAEARRWRPPYVSGRDLYTWARSMASGIVEDAVYDVGSGSVPTTLADRLNRGAARAMLPGATPEEASRPVRCPQEGQGVVGVTAPEAICVAESLRKQLPAADLQRLRDRSFGKAAQVAFGASRETDVDPCVLQGDDCVCLTYSARPLHCRPLHAATLARELELDLTVSGDPASSLADHMEMVGFGVSEGLVQGLDRVGLDANRYELHSAVALAIDRPDAAERWAAGEDVFAGCRLARSSHTSGPQLLR